MARGIIFLLIAALILEVLFCRWLAKRKWRPGTTRMTVAAGIAALVGPACAVLPYTDYLPPSESGSRRVAVGCDRGLRHWDRRFCIQHEQQGRGYNLRPDQYPRPRLLGIHSRLCLHGWREVRHTAAEQ